MNTKGFMKNYLRKIEVGRAFLVVFGWFLISHSSVGRDMTSSNLIKDNNLLFHKRVSLYVEVLKNSQSSEVVERQIKLSVTNEIENIAMWLEIDISKVMEANGQPAKIWESERKGRLDGLLQEMRSALEGAHRDLPNSSTLAQRLIIVRRQIIMFNEIYGASPLNNTKKD